MAGEIIVLVTCPNDAESENLARFLVEEQLAACVNIIPGVTSLYFWEGKICQDKEQLLVIKTGSHLFENLRDRVKQLHSYSVPEIISFPIDNGYQPYLEWLNGAIRTEKSSK